MKKLIAYCGLDCEKCEAYIATKNNDDVLRRRVAALWSKLNHVEITPEMINCEGCRYPGKKTMFCEGLCEIRKCAMKNNFETCGNCEKLDHCDKVEMVIGNNKEAYNNLKEKK